MINTTIKLISRRVLKKTDKHGEAVERERSRTIYAELHGVKRSEFYQAQAVGLRPQLTFLIYDFEYKGEKTIEYDGRRYNILRSYPTGGERLELVCNELAELR